jgi:16S rRNA G966 N2-methylase RsmD
VVGLEGTEGLTLMQPYYEHAGITIYHGDCREILPHLPKVDLVLTDPPYGISYASNHGASWQGAEISNDQDTSVRDEVLSMCAGTPMAVFGTWKTLRPRGVRQVLIFDKGPAFGMGDLRFPWKNSFEEVYIIGDGWGGARDEAVLRGHVQVTWESKGRQHPNQKPTTLFLYLLQKHTAATILDPFTGSGTTLVAAKQLGRRAIGIEIEERYCEIAANRLAQEVLPLVPKD